MILNRRASHSDTLCVRARSKWRAVLSVGALAMIAGPALAQHGNYGDFKAEPLEWREAESGILANQIQLTHSEQFFKAGEQYFSPDMQWIIFQAVPAPSNGAEPETIYSMYVAPLEYESDSIVGIGEAIRVSPPESANTCGFFHPIDPGHIIFATTLRKPSPSAPPGFQRESKKYKWMFPPEMEIVSGYVPAIEIGDDPGRPALTRLTKNEMYDAECAYSPDGRFIVYATLHDDERMCDLYVYDFQTKGSTLIVAAPGYDGGPFFSPDGERICYRSDRNGDNLLQIFVADLEFDEKSGAITGITGEHQLTNNKHVNWGPYWHPGGRHIVYATSEVGHHNYEVFIVDADPGNMPGSPGPARYGTNQRRVTYANGFDGLPVFSPDGRYMIWSSQRVDDPVGKDETQIWIADFVLPLD